MMEPPSSKPTGQNLFEVYLRLRPPPLGLATADRILNIEPPPEGGKLHPSHITLNPPTDRRRAIEKFAFTKVFDDEATQLDVFQFTEIASLAEGVLAPKGGEGTDAVIATLGVTGSGKTHTILGSKTQRGITQLALDVVFRSLNDNVLESTNLSTVLDSLQKCDSSESVLSTASHFLDHILIDPAAGSRAPSRANTPMIVDLDKLPAVQHLDSISFRTWKRNMIVAQVGDLEFSDPGCRVKDVTEQSLKGDHGIVPTTPRRNLAQPSVLPQLPDISAVNISCDPSAEYAVVVSMYEVHNDRIYDLLTPATKMAATKEFRRRPLLFKSTELSPDRKVVAGLRKVVCTTLTEAITVLEAGLLERRVAGTGSNSVSSRSHGFFCFEIKKRGRGRRPGSWIGSKLTIVDLAGSERAREAKTQGATLVEAGKINESLMYLGQCLQTQSEASSSSKPNVVPYRQCKLTELLFSNSFPSLSSSLQSHGARRSTQRGVMIVTADPRGDFNATSQILRYSALAREVTVPRIPSITATILAQPAALGNSRSISPVQQHSRPFMPPGASSSYRNHTPPLNADERVTMEIAALEIARMSDAIDLLNAELDEQVQARTTAEAHLLTVEDRMLDVEASVREACATEFEQRLMLELARFKASLALEQERNEDHWDRKVDILERGLDTFANDPQGDKENVLVEDLTSEVERLRRENAVLKRELAGRSPVKRKPLGERDEFLSSTNATPLIKTDSIVGLGQRIEQLKVGCERTRSTSGSVQGNSKRVRKLGCVRRWEEATDEMHR
ncbi:kinesin [Moelleriella libera RCEF 2490]|uniref:Kinesin-like protein n=1 Tax=Moelleriella libera RCEF 2490 TaxID=1081109 RepID=A0A162IS79_9HYPO|nr:kinesin [Moelleriella libera RCEF 2490]